MTEAENTFYLNQKLNPRVGYCSSYTDRKWKLSDERIRKRQHRYRDEYVHFEDVEVDTYSDDETGEVDAADVYTPGSCDEKDSYEYETLLNEKDDHLPYTFRFPRDGLRSVRPDVYALVNYLSCSQHMSERLRHAHRARSSGRLRATSLLGSGWVIWSVAHCGVSQRHSIGTPSCLVGV